MRKQKVITRPKAEVVYKFPSLVRVEIDSTMLDLIAVNGEMGIPIGRATVTAAIKDHTKTILGFSVSFVKRKN